jgi:hypothetical protein
MASIDIYIFYTTFCICMYCLWSVLSFPKFENEEPISLKSFYIDQISNKVTITDIKQTLILAVYYSKPDYEVFYKHQERKGFLRK